MRESGACCCACRCPRSYYPNHYVSRALAWVEESVFAAAAAAASSPSDSGGCDADDAEYDHHRLCWFHMKADSLLVPPPPKLFNAAVLSVVHDGGGGDGTEAEVNTDGEDEFEYDEDGEVIGVANRFVTPLIFAVELKRIEIKLLVEGVFVEVEVEGSPPKGVDTSKLGFLIPIPPTAQFNNKTKTAVAKPRQQQKQHHAQKRQSHTKNRHSRAGVETPIRSCFFIHCFADVDATDGHNNSAVTYAITHFAVPHCSQSNLVHFFIRNGANVSDIANAYTKVTPLFNAIDDFPSSHIESARLIIDAGSDLSVVGDAAGNGWFMTPFAFSVAEGHADVVALLIAEGEG